MAKYNNSMIYNDNIHNKLIENKLEIKLVLEGLMAKTEIDESTLKLI